VREAGVVVQFDSGEAWDAGRYMEGYEKKVRMKEFSQLTRMVNVKRIIRTCCALFPFKAGTSTSLS
jgi:hypothetical protein